MHSSPWLFSCEYRDKCNGSFWFRKKKNNQQPTKTMNSYRVNKDGHLPLLPFVRDCTSYQNHILLCKRSPEGGKSKRQKYNRVLFANYKSAVQQVKQCEQQYAAMLIPPMATQRKTPKMWQFRARPQEWHKALQTPANQSIKNMQQLLCAVLEPQPAPTAQASASHKEQPKDHFPYGTCAGNTCSSFCLCLAHCIIPDVAELHR